MKTDIRLFINNEEVEFSKDPKILLNYTEKELHNPTIVKNSFTKSIEIEGTNKNNDVFGHVWNLDRYQTEGFNPIQKTDFQLFVNGELFQTGYAKLDKVVRTNNTTTYSITLYGGLGDFFANLSYEPDTANGKKTLASLKYAMGTGAEPDLSFDITKETVKDAWDAIMGETIGDDKWEVINFAPCYNGIPDDFDANKVLINNREQTMGLAREREEDGTTYRPVYNGNYNYSGYSMGELIEDLTEWETRDLRSYNQRPVFSIYRFFEAIKNPANNGGYEVALDSHFFHMSNPYYADAWMTLPMLRDLEGTGNGDAVTIYGATVSNTATNYLHNINFTTPTISALNNVKMRLQVGFSPTTTTSASRLFTHRNYKSNTSFTILPNQYVKEYEYNDGVILQLFAFDSNGNVVGQSKAYLLASMRDFPKTNDAMWKFYYQPDAYPEDYGTDPEYEFLQGIWTKINGSYVFTDRNGNPTYIDFTFPGNISYNSLGLKIMYPNGEYTKYAFLGKDGPKEDAHETPVYLFSQEYYFTTGNRTKSEVRTMDRVSGNFTFNITSFQAIAADYEGLFSGTKISKDKLLSTDYTPADFLLSYCKMFGLYFYHDSTEDASDTAKYPKGVVHIMDRDTFYTEEVVDLSPLIDWNKKITITPTLADAKWYKYDLEHIDGEVDKEYEANYGQRYGSQLINTNYNFNNDVKDLYDGNIFKAGVQVLEKDKYYKMSSSGSPTYIYNGMTYYLYNKSDGELNELELTAPSKPVATYPSINKDNLAYYDAFAKPQMHEAKNSAVDGDGVLLFFKGPFNLSTPYGTPDYYLTDDVADMVALNDATPCWILTQSEYDGGGNRIAYRLDQLPLFTRDLTIFGENGNIVHSWNFGHPQVTYRPNVYTTDGDAIYDIAWRDYTRDLYNENTRKLTCYVRVEMDGRPWTYWLRRFYWFENSLWALNSIKDLNMASFDTTLMEFIKVNDIDNYKLAEIQYNGSNQLILNSDSVGCNGGTITGRVVIQSGGRWFSADWITGVDGQGNNYSLDPQIYMSPYSGQGYTTNFTITIPATTAETPITWSLGVIDDYDNWESVSFTQASCASRLYFDPSSYRRNAQAGTMLLTFVQENIVPNTLTVSKDADWLGEPSISGNNRVFITNSANTTMDTRTGYVYLRGTGTDGRNYQASAAIVQYGQEYEPGWIEFNSSALTVTWPSGTTDESFTFGGSLEMSDLRVTGGDGWATPRIQSATSEVFIDYTENAGASARTTYIKIYGYDDLGMRRTATLQLTQNAQPQQTIFVNPAELDMTYVRVYGMNLSITGTSGNYNITITDN